MKSQFIFRGFIVALAAASSNLRAEPGPAVPDHHQVSVGSCALDMILMKLKQRGLVGNTHLEVKLNNPETERGGYRDTWVRFSEENLLTLLFFDFEGWVKTPKAYAIEGTVAIYALKSKDASGNLTGGVDCSIAKHDQLPYRGQRSLLLRDKNNGFEID